MYVCLCIYRCTYLSMYVCMYACMHVCMHASCIYDDRLFGGAHETAMGGWEMAAGASRAQESQVRRKLPGGLGKGRACGWSCKSVQDVVGPNECLFVCPKPCFLFLAQPGLGGREGDSLGEWWVGAVGREMGTVALGWVAGPVHAATQSKQASKESRVEMWRCGISAAEFWESHDDHELWGRFCFHPCKVLFYFWFSDWVHLVFSKEKWF